MELQCDALLRQGLIYLSVRGTVPAGAALLRHSGKKGIIYTMQMLPELMEEQLHGLTCSPGRATAALALGSYTSDSM